ncbi:MAG: hypothetical protein OJF49_002110 [Ktedonobacterales bacterium]|nr:MAG: hypothetical protein OJF49_002110 [Ktedonobacterales bacterium]
MHILSIILFSPICRGIFGPFWRPKSVIGKSGKQYAPNGGFRASIQ